MSAPLCSCDVYDYNGSKRTCSQAAELTAKLEAVERELSKLALDYLSLEQQADEQTAKLETTQKDSLLLNYLLAEMMVPDVDGPIFDAICACADAHEDAGTLPTIAQLKEAFASVLPTIIAKESK